MNIPLQPIGALIPPATGVANGASPSVMQEALSLRPTLASQAAGQAWGMPSGLALNQLGTTLKPLHPSFSLSGSQAHSDSQIKKVSKDFESIFVRMLFSEMRKTVEKNPLFGNSRAMEFFESMQDDQMSNQLASRGGFGIGRILYQKLKAVTSQHQKVFS